MSGQKLDLEKAIELVQAHNEYPNIVIGGDFNSDPRPERKMDFVKS